MDECPEYEPLDELIAQRPKRKRARRVTCDEVVAYRDVLRRGDTERATEWLLESGALD